MTAPIIIETDQDVLIRRPPIGGEDPPLPEEHLPRQQRKLGTNEWVIDVCADAKTLDLLEKELARNQRKTGTARIVDVAVYEGNVRRITIHHTCRNNGNHQSDASKALLKAFAAVSKQHKDGSLHWARVTGRKVA